MSLNFNPELFDRKPTHVYDGRKVKIHTSTIYEGDDIASAVILEEGDSYGMWTSVELSKCVKID